jgi:poly(A) polymerase
MNPSDSIYHRVRWDPRFDPARFVIGVDMHAEQPKRVPLVDFVPGGDLPWHRVLFFEADGEVVWDRRTGVDRLDATSAGRAAAQALLALPEWVPAPVVGGCETRRSTLRILTWNTLFDRFERDKISTPRRIPLLVEVLGAADADVIALQEVEAPLVRALSTAPALSGFSVVDPDNAPRHGLLVLVRGPLREAARLTFGPHKGALGVVVDGPDGAPVVVVTTHLLSDHARDGARRRREQLDRLAAAVADVAAPLVVLGDFNDDGGGAAEAFGARDAWTEAVGDEAPTFDPVHNPLAALATLTGEPVRIDRLLLRGALRAVAAERLGTEPTDGLFPSDHYAVAATLAPVEAMGTEPLGPPNPRTALCWVLPDELAGPVQALRARHDPSFARWPPHVNVVWGFVEEPHLDEALLRLSASLAAVPPFDVALDGLRVFRHRDDGTVWLDPAAAGPAPWQALARAVAGLVPRDGRAFVPHLSVGRTARPEADAATWRLPPLAARVERLTVLTRRGDGPMTPRATVALGTGRVAELLRPPPPRADLDPGQALAAIGAVLPVEVTGSRRLGCALEGADLDLVGAGDPAVVAAALAAVPGAAEVRVVTGRTVGVRLRHGGLPVDLALEAGTDGQRAAARAGVDDALALLRHVGTVAPAFRRLARVVKGWARAQGLDAAPAGGVPGLGWCVLAARTASAQPELDERALVRAFFESWAELGGVVALDGRPPDPGAPLTILCPAPPSRSCTEQVGPLQLAVLRAELFAAWEVAERLADPLPALLTPPDLHRRHGRWLLVEAEPSPTAAGRVRGRLRALLQVLEEAGATSLRAWPRPVGPSRWAVAIDGPRELAEAAAPWARSLGDVQVREVPAGEVPELG